MTEIDGSDVIVDCPYCTIDNRKDGYYLCDVYICDTCHSERTLPLNDLLQKLHNDIKMLQRS